jgi:restriction system protein
VRELLGTLKDANIEKGVLVTLRGCTSEAKELADKHGIRVVEEMELVELMRNVDGSTNRRIGEILNDDRKLCPRCEHPLVIRTATKGMNQGEQFWGCSNYPRCRYILRDR